MKKHDAILIGGLLALALVLFGLFFLLRQDGDTVIVRVDGVEVARYRLSQDGEYVLNGGSNTLKIENGGVRLIDANCPDLLCVRQGVIRYAGQTITCLPNRLTVTVSGRQNGGVDLQSR